MDSSKKRSILQIANILTPLLCFLITGIFSIFKSEALETFESEGDSSLVDPIGFAFSIWFLIFFFLAIFLIYQSKDIFKSPQQKKSMLFIVMVSILVLSNNLDVNLKHDFISNFYHLCLYSFEY